MQRAGPAGPILMMKKKLREFGGRSFSPIGPINLGTFGAFVAGAYCATVPPLHQPGAQGLLIQLIVNNRLAKPHQKACNIVYFHSADKAPPEPKSPLQKKCLLPACVIIFWWCGGFFFWLATFMMRNCFPVRALVMSAENAKKEEYRKTCY